MKKSELQQIIKEEIKNILNEARLTPKADKTKIPAWYLKDDERGRRWVDSLNKTIKLLDKYKNGNAKTDFEAFGEELMKSLPQMYIQFAVDPKDGISFPSNFIITNRSVNKEDMVYKKDIIYAGGPGGKWWLTHWGASY